MRNGFKVGPNYCRPVAPVADHWIDDRDPNVGSEPAHDASWWQTFNDPVLDSLVQTAYRQNLTLRIAGLRILEARAQRGIAVGELFPQSQQAFGDYMRTNVSQNTPQTRRRVATIDEWTVGTSLAWELDFWGRFRRAIESADARLDASVDNYDDVLVLLLAEVAQQYTNVRTAEQRLEYARKNVDDQRKSLRLADFEVSERGDDAARRDPRPIEPVANRGDDPAAGGGAPAGGQPTLHPDGNAAAEHGRDARQADHSLRRRRSVAVGIPADLLRRRPDVRRAEREAAAQCAQIGIATAELYPHFSITGSVFFDAGNFKDLFDPRSLAGNVGPTFNWNILNYGRLVNNIRVQDARFQQLVLAYQDTVLRANAEVENALVGFLKAQQAVKFLATSTDAATQSLDLVRIQYNEGKTDFNRVLNVEQLLTQQEDQLAVARGAVAQNLILVYKVDRRRMADSLGPEPPTCQCRLAKLFRRRPRSRNPPSAAAGSASALAYASCTRMALLLSLVALALKRRRCYAYAGSPVGRCPRDSVG